MAYGSFLAKALNFIGIALSLFGIAKTYEVLTNDKVVKRSVKCRYCRKRISEKVSCLFLSWVLVCLGKIVEGRSRLMRMIWCRQRGVSIAPVGKMGGRRNEQMLEIAKASMRELLRPLQYVQVLASSRIDLGALQYHMKIVQILENTFVEILCFLIRG